MRSADWILRTFICLTIMGYSTQALSQRYQFSERSAIKGLPSKETYEIFQARDGFLWIASDEGIIRYDGYEPTIFNATKGLPDPVIFNFFEDSDSAIWFRSLSGKTSYYKNGKVTLYPHSKKIEAIAENNYLHSIIRNDDRLYFGAGLSIGYINDKGEVIEELIAKRTMLIRSIGEKSLIFGMMGFSTRAKQIDFDRTIYPIQLSDTLTYNKVIRALKIKSDVYVSINSDIFRISENGCEKVFTGRGPIISLSVIDEGNLWVGYLNSGADQLTIRSRRIVKNEIMLDTKSVSSALRDKEGGLWISTLESGVYYIENPSYQFMPLPYKPTVSIFKNNQLFVGDQSGELTIYRYPELTPTWKMKTNQPMRSLYIDRDENLWMASDRTNVIDLRSKSIKKYFPHSFSSFAEDSTHVWATGGARIDKFNLKKNDNQVYPITNIHSLTLPVADKLLVSKRLGLDIYSKEGKFIDTMEELQEQKISQLLSIAPTKVLIATIGGGLFFLDTKSLQCKALSSPAEFPANYIYHMTVSDSSLFLSTESGIVITKVHSLLHQDPNTLFKEAQRIFGKEKFQTLHVVENKILGINDDGIMSIPLSEWIDPTAQPKFHYEIIGGQSVMNKVDNLTLDYNKPLKVKFGYISFKNQNIPSRYRLSPNPLWIEIANREIDLSALASGEHAFELQSSLDGKNWITRLQLTLQILPPWWKSWNVIVALVLLTVVISILIVRIRLKRFQEKESLLNLIDNQRKKLIQSELETIERERTRIAKDLHDGVGTDLAAIKLSVHKIIEQSDPEMAKEINTYFQDTIKEIRFIIQDLAPPGIIEFGLRSSIQNYFDKVIAKFNMKVDFDWEGEEFTDPQRGTIIFRTIQELVTNSIKHSKGQFIDLKIVCQNNGLLIHYADDGVGFEMHNSFDGLGLRNIKSRVEFLNGKLQFASRVNHTSFEIEIPH